jgi:pimeloyl-ACP methyl ester carboxylesterase
MVFLKEEELSFKTRDGILISALLFSHSRRKKPLIIVAPGFSQNKDTPIMRRSCSLLAVYGDVLCVDFRGTGQSTGRYHFGAEEHLDLEAVFFWARKRKREIELIGFSMGGYIALRAASEFPGFVKRLYLVSAPTCIEDIIKTLGPIRQVLSLSFKPEVLKIRKTAGSDYFFRWGSALKAKPKGERLARNIKIPVSVLVGMRDYLVLPKLSRRIYEELRSKKLWTEVPRGHHAEYLAVMRPKEFQAWFLKSRKELSVPKRAPD